MKIVILRGAGLAKGEMRNYLPMAGRHCLSLIGRPVKKEDWGKEAAFGKSFGWGEILAKIPGGIFFWEKYFGDPQWLWGLGKVCQGAEIVHTAELANAYSFQAVRLKRKGLVRRVVVTCWETIPGAREETFFTRKMKQEVVLGADLFLAATKRAAELLFKEGVEKERVRVVPMGTELVGRKRVFLKKKEKRILFVGRLEEEKGVWELLVSFDRLIKTGYQGKLVLVGIGSQEKKMRKFCQEKDLVGKVVWKGWLSQAAVLREYEKADSFVLPSKTKPGWEEQFGLVLIEAMAAGLPVVATRSGAIPEIVGRAACLVKPGSSESLAKGLEKIWQDEALARSLSRQALSRVKKRYNCQKIAGKIEELYKGLFLEDGKDN